MEEIIVIFNYDGVNYSIQCTKEQKMGDICHKFATKIDKNLNYFLFLYNGSQLNFKLSFKEQANSFDIDNKQMKVLVYKKENDIYTCQKCGEKIKFNTQKIDEILLANNEIQETINGIKLNIENIIKNKDINSIIIQLKNIIKVLKMTNEDIKKNSQRITNLIDETSNYNNFINSKTINNNSNAIKDESIIKEKSDIKPKQNNNIKRDIDNNDKKEGIKKTLIERKLIKEQEDNKNKENKQSLDIDLEPDLKVKVEWYITTNNDVNIVFKTLTKKKLWLFWYLSQYYGKNFRIDRAFYPALTNEFLKDFLETEFSYLEDDDLEQKIKISFPKNHANTFNFVFIRKDINKWYNNNSLDYHLQIG